MTQIECCSKILDSNQKEVILLRFMYDLLEIGLAVAPEYTLEAKSIFYLNMYAVYFILS